MAELVVLYKTPKDAAAFDKHYAETHIPLAKKLPGLKKYAVSKGPVGSPAGRSGVHRVAILSFNSVADIQAAFGSEEGKAAAGDVPKFASGGADLLIFATQDVWTRFASARRSRADVAAMDWTFVEILPSF